MILTSEWRAEHPFAGQNTQHACLNTNKINSNLTGKRRKMIIIFLPLPSFVSGSPDPKMPHLPMSNASSKTKVFMFASI